MDRNEIKEIVQRNLIQQMIRAGKGYFIPVAVSNRHVHLSAADIETLFGKEYTLTKLRELNQPGQYACQELVILTGPKGSIQKIRVLGPARRETQVEILQSDSFRLGIPPAVRMSGELEGTPGGNLAGPAGSVDLKKGVIIAARHLHMAAEEAGWFGLKTGDIVSVKKGGQRSLLFGNVTVRAGEGHSLEMHIDTDEANAAGMQCGEILELIK